MLTTTQPPRQAPHNIEAEQALLGAILINNEAYERVSDFLLPEHFYEPLHGRIYAATSEMIKNSRVVTPVTLKTVFEHEAPISDDLTVPQYLGRLAAGATTIINAKEYGQTVYDLAVRRYLIIVGEGIVEAAYEARIDEPPREQIEQAERALFELAEHGHADSGQVTFNTALMKTLKQIDKSYSNRGQLPGLATGFSDLDRMTGGMMPGNLIILAGRPSMGKAQPLDALVKTVDGWCPMGHLSIGDEVASVDGNKSVVTGVFPQGVEAVFEVTFSDGRKTRCSAPHLWTVHYREWDEPRILTTQQIIEKLQYKRYQNRLWIDKPTGDYGHTDQLPIDPYVLGALLANGGFTSGTPKITTPYPHIKDKVAELLGDKLILSRENEITCRIVRFGMPYKRGFKGAITNPLNDELKALGLFGKKSEEKFIPEIYKLTTRENRIRIIQGMIDGDGWCETFNSIQYGTSSKALMNDFVELVRSVGGTAHVREKQPKYTYKGEKKSGLTHYICTIDIANPHELLTLPEKLSRVSNKASQRRVNFKSIEYSGTEETQCISVSHPSNLYITDDYIVTHNTAMAVNMAWHIAHWGQLPVHFFSLEMSDTELTSRILSDVSGIDSIKLRKGDISEKEFRHVIEAGKSAQDTPVIIDQTGGISISRLTARARRVKRQHDTQLIVVDYLQLMTGSNRHSNRTQEVSEISMGLKAIGKELEVPVLALSQLSRAVESRDNKRPRLADLRESGSLEQDTDQVWFAYREDYYLEREEPNETDVIAHMEWKDKMEQIRGKAELNVAKQRHGPLGRVDLVFDAKTTRFRCLDRDH